MSGMENEFFGHFEELLGTKQARVLSLNWKELSYPRFNLEDLDLSIKSVLYKCRNSPCGGKYN
jgi:hypothetical protein